MSIAGAPDWFRQVLAQAQVVLPRTALANGVNTFAGRPTSGVPGGYRGLVVLLDAAAVVDDIVVTGASTGYVWGQWATTAAQSAVIGPLACLWISDIDPKVTITVTCTAAGGHVMVVATPECIAPQGQEVGPRGGGVPGLAALVGGYQEGTGLLWPALVGANGELYSTPVAPSSLAGTHPVNELGCACANNQSANVVIANAPGAGMRYRFWGGTVWVNSLPAAGTMSVDLVGITASVHILHAGANSAGAVWHAPGLTVPVGGLPCPTNTAITLEVVSGGAGGGAALVSVEAV